MSDPITNFWASGKELKETSKFHAAVQQLLHEIRPTLDGSGKTAQSIAAKDSWGTIAQHADAEGLKELAEILRMEADS